VEKLSAYNIAFAGLKEGIHYYDFDIGDSFFENFENSLLDQAAVHMNVSLEKRNSFMTLTIELKGTVVLICDRCLDKYDQFIENKVVLIIKTGEAQADAGDEVIWIRPEDHQFNLAQLMYEYICLSIPLKHIHPQDKNGKNGCNPEMLKKLEEYTHSKPEKTDERWEQLKFLINNKN